MWLIELFSGHFSYLRHQALELLDILDSYSVIGSSLNNLSHTKNEVNQENDGQLTRYELECSAHASDLADYIGDLEVQEGVHSLVVLHVNNVHQLKPLIRQQVAS